MDDVVRGFKNVRGDLRLVITYTGTSWEIEYITDELDAAYTDSDFEHTFRYHMGNQVAAEDLSERVHGGDFYGQVYLFEDLITFQFPSSRYDGILVSYDWTDSFSMKAVVDEAESLEF